MVYLKHLGHTYSLATPMVFWPPSRSSRCNDGQFGFINRSPNTTLYIESSEMRGGLLDAGVVGAGASRALLRLIFGRIRGEEGLRGQWNSLRNHAGQAFRPQRLWLVRICVFAPAFWFSVACQTRHFPMCQANGRDMSLMVLYQRNR